MGMTPDLDVSPTVGLMPTTPLMLAGPIIDVSVSVPKAIGTTFAATETAEPELEPSVRSLSLKARNGEKITKRLTWT